ncbi:fungal trichothecene efflux pump [Halenospora varia]|nr:fungal trichothecene efflux pump [Halenospora varia]
MHIGVQEHPVEGDHASKSDVITEHRENEKDVSSTQSPVESVTPAAEHVTAKTWIVIFILSSTFGLSFWPVPTTAAMTGTLATKFGNPTSAYWMIPAYTTANAIGFLLCGANSDLFGRRIFLLFGNALCIIGMLLSATAHSHEQFIAGLGIAGFGGGACQMAMCSIPELMPNKYRHIGIVISDGFVFFIVVVGPVVGRYAIDVGNNWRYIYYGGFVAEAISMVGLYSLYHPPQHPKGVPWREGLAGLDYVGALLVTPGVVLTLVGIIFTTYKKSTDKLVIVPLVVGIACLVAFGLWETFSNTKYKLCPPHIFRSHKGREFTVPFILAFIVTMFYYGINIVYPTMINVFYVTPTTSRSETLLLTLPGNLGLVFGAMLLICFGNLLGHWKLTLIASFVGMTIWGGLIALVTPYNKGLMIAFTFLEQTFFGWAQYESVAFTQLGVAQVDLGISGGLAGVARYAGGSLAQAIYVSILANCQASRAAATVPAAAIKAGLPESSASQLLAAFGLGAKALAAVPGVTPEILGAASDAFKWSYAYGLQMVTYASLAFGGVAIICCCLCENIDAKMNNNIEIYLENDVNADKNKFH